MLDLVEKQLVTDQIVLDIGYDIENLTNPDIRKKYHGEVNQTDMEDSFRSMPTEQQIWIQKHLLQQKSWTPF